MAQEYQCQCHLKFYKIPLLTYIKRTLTVIRTFSVIHVAQNSSFFPSKWAKWFRDLWLPKDSAGVLGSWLKSKNLLSPGTSFSWYRNRWKEFIPYISQDGDLVYCSDVSVLMEKFSNEYDVNEWRLVIDSSKISLKIPPSQLAILCTWEKVMRIWL
jgi:hypothetical protein